MLVVLALVPSLWTAWLLWIAPVDGLTADRTALAARDFTALWAAGQAAADHALAVLSDPAAFTAYLRTRFGADMPNQIWPYPPSILLLARPLAELPLDVGFVVYSAASVAGLMLATGLGGIPWQARTAILFSPAVATNALAGQNGTLIAALLCGGLLLIEKQPILSGILLGAVTMKPQFALLLPICVLANAQWRVALSSCVTALAIAFLSAYFFGYEPWVAFLSENQNSVSAYIGASWQSEPAQLIFSSAFMATRSVGGGLAAAYIVQACVTCGCAWWTWQVWRDPEFDTRQRVAATLPLILLAAPWVHTYDMPALAVSVALLAPGSVLLRRVLLGAAWVWPGLPPMIAVSPVLMVLSLGSVAWVAGSSSRHGFWAPRPA